jgi:hypothetical protein
MARKLLPSVRVCGLRSVALTFRDSSRQMGRTARLGQELEVSHADERMKAWTKSRRGYSKLLGEWNRFVSNRYGRGVHRKVTLLLDGLDRIRVCSTPVSMQHVAIQALRARDC